MFEVVLNLATCSMPKFSMARAWADWPCRMCTTTKFKFIWLDMSFYRLYII